MLPLQRPELFCKGQLTKVVTLSCTLKYLVMGSLISGIPYMFSFFSRLFLLMLTRY